MISPTIVKPILINSILIHIDEKTVSTTVKKEDDFLSKWHTLFYIIYDGVKVRAADVKFFLLPEWCKVNCIIYMRLKHKTHIVLHGSFLVCLVGMTLAVLLLSNCCNSDIKTEPSMKLSGVNYCLVCVTVRAPQATILTPVPKRCLHYWGSETGYWSHRIIQFFTYSWGTVKTKRTRTTCLTVLKELFPRPFLLLPPFLLPLG